MWESGNMICLIYHVATTLKDRVKSWVEAKCRSYRYCGMKDTSLLFCHKISGELVIRGSCALMGRLPSP